MRLRQKVVGIKLSVGSGIEDMASNPGQPIRTARFENPTDRLADCLTGSRSLSKWTIDFEDLRVTGNPDTKFQELHV